MARRTHRDRLTATPNPPDQVQDRVRIPHKYWPRTHQRRVLAEFDAGCRHAILVHHRRAGKDKTALQVMIKKMVQRVGSYYYYYPVATQARKVIWDGMDDNGFPFLGHFPPELIEAKNETEMQIRLKNGSIFQIIGTDKIDTTGVGTNQVGVVYSEYAIQDPKARQLTTPILRANGGWELLIFTPRGKNHAYDLWIAAQKEQGWFTELLTVDQTRRDARDDNDIPLPGEHGGMIVSQEDIDEERRLGMPEEIVQQEFYCSWDAGLVGSYYGEALKQAYESGRITKVPWDQNLPVYTAWDLGAQSDTMSVGYVQLYGPHEIRWIDYDSGTGKGLGHYIHGAKEKRPYIYEAHYMPHDVEATEISSGKTRIEVARKLGLTPIKVQGIFPVMDGIEAVRRIFNKFWFDDDKCADLVEALKNYRKEWDHKRKMFKDTPYHDWASHPADMVRTFALGYRGPRKTQVYKPAVLQFDPFRYAEAETEFDPFANQ